MSIYLSERRAVSNAGAGAAPRRTAAARLAHASGLCLAVRARGAGVGAAATGNGVSGLCCAGDRLTDGCNPENFSTSAQPLATSLPTTAGQRVNAAKLLQIMRKAMDVIDEKRFREFFASCQAQNCVGEKTEYFSCVRLAEINAPLQSAFTAASSRTRATEDEKRFMDEEFFLLTLTPHGAVAADVVTFGDADDHETVSKMAPVPLALLRSSAADLPQDRPEHALLQRWGATFYHLDALGKFAYKEGFKVAILPDLTISEEDGGHARLTATLRLLLEQTQPKYKDDALGKFAYKEGFKVAILPDLTISEEDGGHARLTATLRLLLEQTQPKYKDTVQAFLNASTEGRFNEFFGRLTESSAGYLQLLKLLAATLPPAPSETEPLQSTSESRVSPPPYSQLR